MANKILNGRTLQGVVVSNKANQTAVVKVTRSVQHPVYKKIVKRSKKLHVHDALNACQEGDNVIIQECPPISKLKHWVLIERNTLRE
jgi:small subunit ribosomal protein S17